jgi:hypothetical protein
MQFRTSAIMKLLLVSGFACLISPVLRAQANPGDPLFCDPNEGVTFLIVNGGSGIFTVNSDCYGGNPANDVNPSSIPTSQGGTITRIGTSLNYTYTPPTSKFTGIDTFPFSVTTVCNRIGGTGSAGGTSCPGGPANFTVSLNVLPATVSITLSGTSPQALTIPAGSVSGCSAVGNAGNGPAPGAVYGCTTALIQGGGGVNPSHGTLTPSGNTLVYTPNGSFIGFDTFTVQVQGVNDDGTTALNSGNVTVTVGAVSIPAVGTFGMLLLFSFLLIFGARLAKRHSATANRH